MWSSCSRLKTEDLLGVFEIMPESWGSRVAGKGKASRHRLRYPVQKRLFQRKVFNIHTTANDGLPIQESHCWGGKEGTHQNKIKQTKIQLQTPQVSNESIVNK